jgi:peptidoglycan/LPS O-acetylase OafA/YrhL
VTPPPAPFRRDLEGLRGVAVLAVVLFHAGVPFLPGGYVGVDVFFVLSGFLITGLLWGELERAGRVSLRRFWARRARRLLPVALLVVLVTAVAAHVLLPPLRARAVHGDALAAALYAGNWAFALQSTDYLADTGATSPLLHFWSLGVEEQFYLAWPLVVVLAASGGLRRGAPSRARTLVAVGGVAVVSFALCVRLTEQAQPWAFFSLHTRAWELAAGAALALLVPQARRLPPLAAAVLGWTGLLAVLTAAVAIDTSTAFPGTAALLPVLGAGALVAAGCRPGAHGPAVLLDTAALRLAGRLSYSWYLWHWPVLVLAAEVAGPLDLPARLALVAASGLLAAVTLRQLEDPVRQSAALSARPGQVLAGALALTAAAAALLVAAPALLPTPSGAVAQAPLPVALPTPDPTPDATKGAAGPGPAPTPQEDTVERAVRTAVQQGVGVVEVPRNVTPALEDAHDDQARPFRDGCHVRFLETRLPPCVYGDPASPTTVALIGDSHATHWFPALETAAAARGWRLLAHGKSTCPPLGLRLWHPGLNRTYDECEQWQAQVLAKLRDERPEVVVLGVARHYGPEWQIDVHGDAWAAALGRRVAELRATGTRVVVLGGTPWPRQDVAQCLSEHLGDARACTFRRSAGVDAGDVAAERAAVQAAGGTYLDVVPWLCAAEVCPVVVGNVLVYRDDNHITTHWASTLAPLVGQAVAAARQGPDQGASRRSGLVRP